MKNMISLMVSAMLALAFMSGCKLHETCAEVTDETICNDAKNFDESKAGTCKYNKDTKKCEKVAEPKAK
jgi:hypothetical protein